MGNVLHHLREAGILFRSNLFSNLMSLFSTTLVFLFLAVILAGWRTTGHWVGLIRSGAEIQIFHRIAESTSEPATAGTADVAGTADTAGTANAADEGDTAGTADAVGTANTAIVDAGVLADKIRQIPGVEAVAFVNAEEARKRMTELMGGESDALAQFGENPFRPFLEARIRLEDMNAVLSAVSALDGVESVRDNRSILEMLIGLERALRAGGLALGIAVGIFTLVLLSHIIRTGVIHNREQIRTLRLLGAPEFHIAFPFFLLGLFLSAGGALLAAGLVSGGISLFWVKITSPLPFLPLPAPQILQGGLFGILGGSGILLGLLGTVSGLLSARNGGDEGHFR
jgi:cell division transport system permease protein